MTFRITGYLITNTEYFLSPSGTSELGCATTKTDAAERTYRAPVKVEQKHGVC